jgi:hypothetical protein
LWSVSCSKWCLVYLQCWAKNMLHSVCFMLFSGGAIVMFVLCSVGQCYVCATNFPRCWVCYIWWGEPVCCCMVCSLHDTSNTGLCVLVEVAFTNEACMVFLCSLSFLACNAHGTVVFNVWFQDPEFLLLFLISFYQMWNALFVQCISVAV